MKSYFDSEWGVNSVKLKPFGSLAACDVIVSVKKLFTRMSNNFDFILSSSVSEKSNERGVLGNSDFTKHFQNFSLPDFILIEMTCTRTIFVYLFKNRIAPLPDESNWYSQSSPGY